MLEESRTKIQIDMMEVESTRYDYDSADTACYDSDAEVEDVLIPDIEEQIEQDEVEAGRILHRKRARRLEEVKRVGKSVLEVMQIQPRAALQQDILVKQDTGAQLSLCAPDLFDYAVEQGVITNVREFEREEVTGIGGGVLISVKGDMEVCIEGSLVPVIIQVIPSASIQERNFQILLGTDNTRKLGAQIDLVEGVTKYTNLPGINRTLSSMHLSPGTANRVFNCRRVNCETDSVERPDFLSPRWNSESRIDAELASIPTKMGEKARFMSEEEQEEMIDKMARKDTSLLKLLVDSLEKCVASGDQAQYREACKMIGVNKYATGADEVKLMHRMAKSNRRLYCDEAELRGRPDDSFTFEYDDKTKTVRPVDGTSDKINQDRAGFGWKSWTKDEIKEHVIKQSSILSSDKYLLQSWIDNLYKSSQPPTAKLPAVKNHYYYVKLKPNAIPWKARYSSVPRNLMGRLTDIIKSMERMDIIEKTDSAEFTCPITLVLGKDKDGNSTISRLCCDAREMNKQLIVEPESVPNMHELMMHAEGGHIYSTTDLVKSFWETKIAPNSMRYCAFRCALGCFLWRRKFFGVRNGSTQQQKLIEEVIGDDLYGEWDGIAVYVDDAVIWSKKKPGESEESVISRHMKILDRFTKRLSDRNITLSIEKSSFFQHSIDFLGYRLGRDGVSLQSQKQAAILDAPHPTTAKELHTFIGSVVWLQKCLQCNAAQLLKPLRKYVIQRSTDKTFVNRYDPDDPEVRQAVTLIKEKIAHATTLHSPRWKWRFHVFADGAQSSGVGGVMAHFIDTGWPGELPLKGSKLTAFQALCEEDGDPPPRAGHMKKVPGTNGVDESAEEMLMTKQRAMDDSLMAKIGKIKYTELEIASGLNLPNRRLLSPQTEPQEPICVHSGRRRVGYYAPIAFHSKSIQKAQARWTSREVEVFAIITMLRRWESYLIGSKLTIHTDCKCLEYLAKYQDTWGKLGRWCNYLAMFSYDLSWCAGVSNGVADYLSRAPLIDNYCPDDGELERDKIKFDDNGDIIFVDEFGTRKKKRTMYSVCAGIGSDMQAIEKLNLPIETIGCCEINPEVAGILERLYPHVPNHGDMRMVIAAMEAGELSLRPDICLFSVPCQSRSKARLLTDWYGKEHPHHSLWDLQAKFVKLAKPKIVIIENVPPRTFGEHPTAPQYDKLQAEIEALGYNYVKVNELNCAKHGAHTSRRRYFGVATLKGYPEYKFPKPLTKYSGFRDVLDPAHSVRHNYRCRLSATKSWRPVRLCSPRSDPFSSMQIGRLLPETEKEEALAQKRGPKNPKGFRIYSSKHPAPTICAYGSEKYCGPGRHTQLITDKVGIRCASVPEAARIHGMIPRAVNELSTVTETLAFSVTGNSIPVDTIGAILGETEPVLAWSPRMVTADAVLLQSKKKITPKYERDVLKWYPSDETMLEAQKADPEVEALREQLQILKTSGVSTLMKLGHSRERVRLLQMHSINPAGLLCCSDVIVSTYGIPEEESKEAEEETELSEAYIVVPKSLRDGILYIHHHSRLAGHASWIDMEKDIHRAGYTWKGLGNSCKQTTKKCMECMKAKRGHSKLAGLHSSRRYVRPFDTLSWDLQDLGKAAETTNGKNRYLLTVLCEFTSFPELYALPDKTAESMANCLVDYCLRWGKPTCIWSGYDAEIKNEVVARVCNYLEVAQVFTTPRNSNGAAKQERKHRQINEQLKILVKGRPREWDEYLPVVTWKLRNSTVEHLGYTPWEMVFGRAPSALSPRSLSQENFTKKHPRAMQYMETLHDELNTMWKEVDRSMTISAIESWPRLNAKRKNIKLTLGDFVMLHQPVHVPGAPTKLCTAWNGPWKITKKEKKAFTLVHIDTGKRSCQDVTNLTEAPDEATAGDYEDRFDASTQRIQPSDRILRDATLDEGDGLVVHVGGRNAIATVLEVYACGGIMVQWMNTRKLDSKRGAMFYKSWYAPDTKHGERAGLCKGASPTWEIIEKKDVIMAFDIALDAEGGCRLPIGVTKFLQ